MFVDSLYVQCGGLYVQLYIANLYVVVGITLSCPIRPIN